MKKFPWRRLAICLVPLLLGTLVVVNAFYQYYTGQGGFRLGVDLVGGTILIYEVDESKFPDGKLPGDWKPEELARRLKNRIDANDLYNITVRVASRTRFEIILPTGGKPQRDAEKRVWDDLLKLSKEKFPLSEGKYLVQPDYGSGEEEVKQLVRAIRDDHPADKPEDVYTAEIRTALGISDYLSVKKDEEKATDKKAAEAKIKEAWDKVVAKATETYPPKPRAYLVDEGHKTALLAAILAQDEKAEYAEVEAFLKKTLEPYDAEKAPEKKSKAWKAALAEAAKKYPIVMYTVGQGKRTELLGVISQLYPYFPRNDVPKLLNFDDTKKSKRGGMNQEQVQERKDLIAQVGSLEFRIPANTNDQEALDAAVAYFRRARDDEKLRAELESLSLYGKPPPAPLPLTSGTLFDTPKGRFGYGWVELGPDFRHEHGLANPRTPDGQLITVREQKDVPLKREYAMFWQAKRDREDWENKVGDASGLTTLRIGEGRNAPSLLIYSRKAPPTRGAEKEVEYFALMRDAESPDKRITGEYLAYAGPSPEGGKVLFRMKPAGGDLFYDLTLTNKGQLLAVVLDGYLESTATINDAIRTSGEISGNFTPDKIERTVQVLRSGALPGTLKREPVSENTMGPTLGEDTIRWGFWSIIGAFIAVLAFMVAYYFFAGFVACIALFANLLLTIAFMVMIDAAFTLPGLAGLVLTLGMAVDANVLIYERIREERKRGVELKRAIANGYDRALPTIIDTHLSSIFTAIVLYIVGNDQLKGFGISLTVGLVISLFTSLYITRLIFDIWMEKGWLTKLTMPFDPFSGFKFNFMRYRWVFFTITIAMTVAGGWLFISRLDSGGLNIDFVGGTAYGGELSEKVTIEELRTALTAPLDLNQLREAANHPVTSEYLKNTLLKGNEDSLKNLQETLKKAESLEELQTLLGKGDLPSLDRLRTTLSLPDLSIEQLYISDPTYTEGRSSKLFTIRTSEKNVGLVSAEINRLIGGTKDAKVRMKKIVVKEPEFLDDQKTVVLSFFLPDANGNPDPSKPEFASRAQLTSELSKVLRDETIRTEAAEKKPDLTDVEKTALREKVRILTLLGQQFNVVGLGKDKEGRYQFMEVRFVEKLDPKALEILKSVAGQMKQSFQDNPVPERLENFDSQLAGETQLRALYAVIASWGAILLYLWFRFGNWTFGLAAVLCLIHDLFFALGAIAVCHYLYANPVGQALLLKDFKIDLPSVAALLTLVGYSVNDTIVVFDRIREVRGKNPALTEQMLNDSINQTLSRTILASFTTFLVVFVLYVMGGEGVHLFAFVMVVGVIVGTYSSIYIAAPLLLMFGEGQVAGSERPAPQPATETAG